MFKNRLIGVLVFISMIISSESFSQRDPILLDGQITGPDVVNVGQSYEYSFNSGSLYISYYWYASNGYVQSQYQLGSTYYATVTFSNVGTAYIYFEDENGAIVGTKTVTVQQACSAPATPVVSFSVGSSTCSPRIVSYTGTTPTGLTWYWQTSSSGTSTLHTGNTYTVTANSTLYIRALDNSTGCWSNASSAYSVTVSTPPTTPTAPTVSTNACGAKTITRGTPPAGVTWYWQGTNSSGQDITNSATTFTANVSGTYYLRARNNSTLCWSTSRSVSVSIVPSQPTATFPTNTCGPVTITRGTPSGTDVWYWQGTTALGTSTTNSASTYDVTTSGTYYLRSRTSSGCWSPTSTAFVITINAVPATPPVFAVSTNTCGPKILTKPVAPSGFTYYWQLYSYQTDMAPENLAETWSLSNDGNNQLFFLRSRNNITGCWSAARGQTVHVDNPRNAADKQFTFCEWETMSLTTTTVIGGSPLRPTTRWFEPATNKNTVGSSITVNKHSGVHTYHVINRSAQGCESLGYGTVTVTVPESCDDKINWGESISYTLDGNGNTVPYTSSRAYSDGHGNQLQTQSKDYVNNKILASQPVHDRNNQPVVGTLPAPITATNFAYKARFITNSDNEKYSANDFDVSALGTSDGSRDYPKPVGQSAPGTLGWYYSSNNTLEPLTPTTSYPYSRSWSEENPDPTQSKSAGPGNSHRMGSDKEVESKREKIVVGELNHYYSLQPYFVSDVLSRNPNQLGYLSTQTSYMFGPTAGASVNSTAGYIIAQCNQTTGNPGIFPMGNVITVTPGGTYTFRIKGYKNSINSANLYVKSTTGIDIVSPGPSIPTGGAASESWVSVTFTIPTGITAVRVGVLWSQPALNDSFMISGVDFRSEIPTSSTGYKYISTDPNEKQSVSFVGFDGKTLATATKNGSVYDNWSYAYYNTMGQVVATVAPNGVNTASTAYPSFVTLYKYDHLGRLIETTAPDEGTSQFVYSLEGDIRFSQSAEQRNASPKRFSYTNYDKLGRLIESGDYIMSDSNYVVFESHSITTPHANSVLNLVDNTGFTGVTRRGNNATATRYSDTTFIEYDVQAIDFITDTLGHTSQTYTLSQVTKTKNGHATTWYSYDEFGQLVWTKQYINGLGMKTVDYDYDFLGNVSFVIYQKGQSDRFYHKYVYNANQKLSEVHTSLDSVDWYVRAKYHYYLHGPLKRIELGNNVQGIDYVYTIDGSLKSINDATLSNDPGEDGTNGFATDVFGQTMHYYDNDYTGGSHTASAPSLSGYTDQYGGALKAVSWHSPTDNNMQENVYAFTYDNKYQLSESEFGDVKINPITSLPTFTPNTSAAYKESIPGYDKNGNIQSLQRKGLNGTTLGNYNYVYEPNTNKLDKVNHNSSTLVDYTYNSIGQMTRQQEGSDVMNVSYTAHGITKEVRNATNQLMVEYAYDDRGDLVKRTDYTEGAAAKYTFYVRDASGNALAMYEQKLPSGTVQLIEMPIYGAGRVAVYRPQLNAYFYEIGDHQGNVRAVIGTVDTDVYTATMETENVVSEELSFKNIDATNAVSVAANHTLGGNEAARLNHAKPAGPAISLKVSPGDKLDISTWAYYEAGSDYDNAIGATPMIAAIASAFGGISGAPGEPGSIFNALNNALGGDAGVYGLLGTDDENLPGAYVCYLVFDVHQKFTGQGGYARVTEAGNLAKEELKIDPVIIEKPGYVYIYVYNRSNSDDFVYFDDFSITHEHSPIVAGSDYYPFGLPMEGREITQEDYRWGYQGQFAEKDSVTGWNQFQLRMYDARFGRWTSIDPYGQYASPYVGMGNMPNIGIDPDGGFFSTDPIVLFTRFPELIVTSSGSVTMSISSLLTPAMNSFMRFESGGSATYWSLAGSWVNYDPNSGAIQSYNNGLWEPQGNVFEIQNAYSRNMMQFSSNGSQVIADASYMLLPTGAVVGVVAKPLLSVGTKVITRITTKALPRIATKGGTTALRKVGSVLESVDDVMANPNLLQGQSYGYVRNMLGNSKNWANDVMRKSTRANGWVLREMNQAGKDFTGRMIQYHPGTPRHFGGNPYWKVSSGNGIFRIPINP